LSRRFFPRFSAAVHVSVSRGTGHVRQLVQVFSRLRHLLG
jgi:hypothetical protein